MKNVTMFDTMLPNIPSYCGSLGYFLDANVRAKLHLNFTYQSLAILALALA